MRARSPGLAAFGTWQATEDKMRPTTLTVLRWSIAAAGLLIAASSSAQTPPDDPRGWNQSSGMNRGSSDSYPNDTNAGPDWGSTNSTNSTDSTSGYPNGERRYR